jgi:hypothetical protein
MNRSVTYRRTFIVHATLIVLMVLAFRTPAAKRVVVGGRVEIASITERILRFPCWLLDHSKSFSLDRLDRTCPQCI